MSAPDHETVKDIERRFKKASRRMHELEGDVATAITVIDYDKDRRKALLARYAKKHIDAGESAAAAETLARADKAYDEEFQQLFSQYELAQRIRKDYETTHISWETGRSLLARQRETIRTLPGTEE
jgi:hypothetical protein